MLILQRGATFVTFCFPSEHSPLKMGISLKERKLLLDGWVDDLRIYALCNSILVISGRWADDDVSVSSGTPFTV